MASANSKSPNLKASSGKKGKTPMKKKGATNEKQGQKTNEKKPERDTGKAKKSSTKAGAKVNGEATAKAEVANGSIETAVTANDHTNDVHSPIDTQSCSNGLSLAAEDAQIHTDFLAEDLNRSFSRAVIMGDLEIVLLSETDVKYIYTKHEAPSGRAEDSSCDIKVEVDGKTFNTHKTLLSNVSNYFAGELKNSSDKVSAKKDTSADGFAMLLEHLYEGSVVVNAENSQILFDTAAYLEVEWIMEAVSHYLIRTMGPENYLSVFTLFEKHNLEKFKLEAENMLAHNLVIFSESAAFLESLEYGTLSDILASNFYVEGSEGFIVKIILDWIDMDPDSRQQHLSNLAKLIRFPLLEPEELERMPDDFTDIFEIKQEIEEAKKYGVNVSGQSLYNGEKYLGRGYRSDVFALISAAEFNNGNLVMYKDLNKPQEPMCVEQLEAGGLQTTYAFTNQATLGNFLYAAGGYDSENCSSPRIFRFDPRYREWIELQPMKRARVSFAMSSSDRNVFAVGGIERIVDGEKEQETPLDFAEMYDPKENTWSDLPILPYGCSELAATFWDGKVYVSGGISSSPTDPIPLDYMLSLSVEGGESWDSLTPMLTGRQGHSMSAINAKICILGGKSAVGLGGFEACRSTELYDTETTQWSKVTQIPQDFGNISRFVGVLGTNIVFVADQHWHCYDTENDELVQGEFCGPEVQRVAPLQVAYPPTA